VCSQCVAEGGVDDRQPVRQTDRPACFRLGLCLCAPDGWRGWAASEALIQVLLCLVHGCTCVCACVCIVCICMHLYAFVYMCMNVYECVYAYLHMNACVAVAACSFMHAWLCMLASAYK
jgi:hypothetical protein